MKRFFKMLVVSALAAATLSSCVFDRGCRCPAPDCGECGNNDSGTNWQILKFNVSDSNWELCQDGNGINPFYRASLEIPELTKEILEKGLMQAYVYYDGGNQQLLPYVRHFEDYVKDDAGEDVQITWTQTVDIEYGEKGAWIYCTSSDFYTGETPGDMSFRIVLMW